VRPRYNSAGGLSGVELDGVPYVERICYDAKGQRMLVAHGNGALTRYSYDPDTFRLRRLRTERFTAADPTSGTASGTVAYQVSGAPLQDFEYGYDLTGNLISLTDRTPDSGIPANPEAGRVADAELRGLLAAGDALIRRFDYDPRYRLTGATGREHDLDPAQPPGPPWTDIPRGNDITRTRGYVQGYAYDAAGNLLRMTHQAGSGSPTRTFALADGGNRLASLTVGADTIGYAYDAAGNLIAEGDSRHFAWDGAGRLRSFEVRAGSSEPSVHAQYLYDAAGERVRKLVRRQGGRLDSMTYVGGAFEHYRQTMPGPGGDTVRENTTIHVGDGQRREALIRIGPPAPGDATPAVTYQAGDHLGSAVLVLDGAGGEVGREEFTPYGDTSFGGHAFKRYRFTGKERDEESGLSYHGARYYAPWLARWTATDPAGPVDGTNLYSYCRGRPMTHVDSNGCVGWLAVAIGVGVITALTTGGTANAPRNAAEAARAAPRMSNTEYAAHAAVNVAGAVRGVRAGAVVLNETGSTILATVTEGAVGGGMAAAGGRAVSDIGSGTASSNKDYLRDTFVGAAVGTVFSFAARAVSRVITRAERPAVPPDVPTPPAATPQAPAPPSAGGSVAGTRPLPRFPEVRPKPAPGLELPPPAEVTAAAAPQSQWQIGALMEGSVYQPTQNKVWRGSIDALAQAMKDNKFQWDQMSTPILVDAQGKIVGGHHRVIAARLAGEVIPAEAIQPAPASHGRAGNLWSRVAVKAGTKPSAD
ncbi:MAG: RHS repeat-associated core domain-containing protein, partial [Nocardioides sp.]